MKSEGDDQDDTPKVLASSQHWESPSKGQTSGLPITHPDVPAKAWAHRESGRTQATDFTPVFYLWCKK